jgi:phage gpG-like protein
MPPVGQVHIQGLRELRRDLKSIDRKLPAQLNKRLKVAADPIAKDAARHAPKRTTALLREPRPGALARSIRVRTSGSKLFLGSSLPYARVVHWGGRHPVFGNRQVWVKEPRRPFLAEAVSRGGDNVERAVFDTIEDFMKGAGFR